MKSTETGSVNNPQATIENEELRGREAISVEKSLATQEDLIWYLTPPVILELIHNERQGNLLEALTERYMSKYVNDELNGFADFCDQQADNDAFIDRVNRGELTTEDFEMMKQFLESHPKGGSFFASPAEVENFISQYNPVGN